MDEQAVVAYKEIQNSAELLSKALGERYVVSVKTAFDSHHYCGGSKFGLDGGTFGNDPHLTQVTVQIEAHGKWRDEEITDVETLREIMDEVAAYFAENLFSEYGIMAREHLTELGVSSVLWADQWLGYAPAAWRDLKEKFGEKYGVKTLISLGLLVEGEEKIYDRFRDRVMYPILDSSGRPICFRGLAIEGEPKTICSPIHELFGGDERGAITGDLRPVDWTKLFWE